MRKCRNWQTSKTKDLVTIAVVWVQVPSSASKDLNLWLGSFFADGDTNPRFMSPLRSGRRKSEIHRISCAPSSALLVLVRKPYKSRLPRFFLFLNCLNTLEHVHIWHFATDCCFVGGYETFDFLFYISSHFHNCFNFNFSCLFSKNHVY